MTSIDAFKDSVRTLNSATYSELLKFTAPSILLQITWFLHQNISYNEYYTLNKITDVQPPQILHDTTRRAPHSNIRNLTAHTLNSVLDRLSMLSNTPSHWQSSTNILPPALNSLLHSTPSDSFHGCHISLLHIALGVYPPSLQCLHGHHSSFIELPSLPARPSLFEPVSPSILVTFAQFFWASIRTN